MKKCSTCKEIKNETDFYLNRSRPDGISNQCKLCHKSSGKRSSSTDIAKEKRRKRYAANPQRFAERGRISRERRKDRIKAYKATEKVRHYNTIYQTLYIKRRRQEDAVFDLRVRIRSATRKALKRGGSPSSVHLLGCTIADLLAIWGVSRVLPGMEIDHIVPLAQAKTERELRMLCHYTNLQLLTKEENRQKSDTASVRGLELCRNLLDREWE